MGPATGTARTDTTEILLAGEGAQSPLGDVALDDPFALPSADAPAESGAIQIKLYGDTQFMGRSTGSVKTSFAAAHLDLFATADVGRLSFLSEVFFEAEDNELAFDVERAQVSYLVANFLRLRAGRAHTAFGYYNDTYHHGNLFELTTSRPYSVQFEDAGGLFTAHLVGAGADGTFNAPKGTLRYDLEVGNGRLADITAVAVTDAGKNGKLLNLRLRYIHDSGFTLGVNGLIDAFPRPDSEAQPEESRPYIREQIAGAHAVYMERRWHVLLEGALVRHAPVHRDALLTQSAFLELGRDVGDFTPYVRGEIVHFPRQGDLIYQAARSPYAGSEWVQDARIGLRYRPMQQIALRVEGQRTSFDGHHTYIGTAKLAFGF
ncbi:MAG: hypothetical protein RL385_3230 [Pseudomonadota bacterium]|jgi:hypothetical protein